MKTNKLLISIILGIMLIGLVSAGEQGENIGTYKAGGCVALPQVCASCTYSKILSIIPPNQTIYNINDLMSKDGAFYNYTFCDTSQLGEYKVSGVFDVDGIDQSFNYVFTITADGYPNTSNRIDIVKLIFLCISVLFSILLSTYGLLKDERILIFASIFFLISGLLIPTFTFINDKNLIEALSIINYGLAFLCLAFGIYEWLPED